MIGDGMSWRAVEVVVAGSGGRERETMDKGEKNLLLYKTFIQNRYSSKRN